MDIVKLKQTHYDELIEYLEQVSPKTAESIKLNNKQREQRKNEIESFQKELEENFKKEREEWERNQNEIIQVKLEQKEREFEEELKNELSKLSPAVDDEAPNVQDEKVDIEKLVEDAKEEGKNQEEIDHLIADWEEQQLKSLNQNQVYL